MATSRKVFSYGVRKKVEDEAASWGSIKEDTKKSAKLPSKKSVWSKATGKTSTVKKEVSIESYDPFELPDDIVDVKDGLDDHKLPSHKEEIKSVKTLQGSPKFSNVVKSKISGKCLPLVNSPAKPKLKGPLENVDIAPPVKDEQSPPKILYGACKKQNVIKSKILGKPLPQNSVTINAEELKLFGSPRKGDESLSPKDNEKTPKILDGSLKNPTAKKNGQKITKTLHGLLKNTTTQKDGQKTLKNTTPQKDGQKIPKNTTLQKDVQRTPKKLLGSLKKKTPQKDGQKISKTLGSLKKKTPQKEGQKKPRTSLGSLKSTASQKSGRKITKKLLSAAKKTPVAKSKIRDKSTQKNVIKKVKDLKLLASPQNKKAKNVKSVTGLKKSNLKNGTPKIANKRGKSQQNNVTPKKLATKNKVVSQTKGKGATDIKNGPKGNKRKVTKTGKVQVKKTMLDTKKVSPRVKVNKAKIDGNILQGVSESQIRKIKFENSPIKNKLPNAKSPVKNKKTLSVQFIDDNTVLEIKQKDVRHVLKDNVIFSNEASDASENHITDRDEYEKYFGITYSDEDDVKSKKSLFSYYDRQVCQANSTMNGNSKEFDFVVPAIDDSVDVTEETSCDDKITLPLKRSRSVDQSDVVATPPKKTKLEDVLKVDFVDSDEKDDLDVDDASGHSKSPQSKSPFKSFKSSAGLRQKQKKNFRRISSLPTNVTLDDEDMEDDDKPDLVTPPPLYRSNIFGFGKSAQPVRVRRDEKELYTVVRNTKHAHECLEYGESQQFKDDLEYLLDGLKSKHNVSTRCLSALELASKCLSPEFRMHIKAHGIIENIFTVLEDAFSEEQLLLCASMILYVLAKDKLKINFNKKTIGFMLQVITQKRPDVSKTQAYERLLKKIRSIFEKLEDVEMDLETIDAKSLAREALLSLTVKRTGEWFKDEIRVLGGLDDIAEKVYSCCQCIQKRLKVDQNCVLMKRCLSLFIDMTYKSLTNQAYLVTCRNSVIIESCIRTLHSFGTSFDLAADITTSVSECIMSIQLILMNLSHENTNACLKICKEEYGLSSILRCALHLSKYLPSHLAYENTIISLCLLVNLVANHSQNRTILNKTVTTEYLGIQCTDDNSTGKVVSPIKALMQMFLLHSEACKEADLMQELEKLEQEENEQNAGRVYQDDEYGLTCGDAFEDTIDDDKTENQEQNPSKDSGKVDSPLNETEKRDIQSTLDKAQRHMEDSHLAAYTALLIGLLIEDEPENQKIVHSLLLDDGFSLLLESIEKIVSFMQMTNPLSKNDQKTMERIMSVIRNCNEQFSEKG